MRLIFSCICGCKEEMYVSAGQRAITRLTLRSWRLPRALGAGSAAEQTLAFLLEPYRVGTEQVLHGFKSR